MEGYYDNGLFTELGEIPSCDHEFYEGFPLSSSQGDVGKQHLAYTFSLASDNLLGTGDSLTYELFRDSKNESLDVDLFKWLDDELQTDNGYNIEPSSPISTLPSEPSSPINLEDFISSMCEPDVVCPVGSPESVDDILSFIQDEHLDIKLIHNVSDSGYESYLATSPSDSISSTPSYSPSHSYSSSSESQSDNEGYPKKSKSTKRSSATPYSKLPSGRKEKKKQQNKEAAIRYRQKKKSEFQTLAEEEALMLEKNSQLKTEVLNLEREIMCMKELLSEIFDVHSLA